MNRKTPAENKARQQAENYITDIEAATILNMKVSSFIAAIRNKEGRYNGKIGTGKVAGHRRTMYFKADVVKVRDSAAKVVIQ